MKNKMFTSIYIGQKLFDLTITQYTKKNKHHRQPLIGVFCNTLIQTLSMYNILACSYIHNNKSLTYIITTVSIKSSELLPIIHVIIRVIAHYSLDYIMLNIAKNTLKLGCTSYKVLSVL
jgi:hypothetical protein